MAIKNCASCSVRKQTVREKKKKKKKRGGSFSRGFSSAYCSYAWQKVRNDRTPIQKTYMHYIQTRPQKRRNTDSPHSPPFFFSSPPLRSWANTRRHDGDAPCVTVSLSRIYPGFFFSLSPPSLPPSLPFQRWNTLRFGPTKAIKN